MTYRTTIAVSCPLSSFSFSLATQATKRMAVLSPHDLISLFIRAVLINHDAFCLFLYLSHTHTSNGQV